MGARAAVKCMNHAHNKTAVMQQHITTKQDTNTAIHQKIAFKIFKSFT